MKNKRRWTIAGICVMLVMVVTVAAVWTLHGRKESDTPAANTSQTGRDWTERLEGDTAPETTTPSRELPGLTVQGEPL